MIAPDIVSDVPVSICTSDAPVIVTAPLHVFDPETLLIAPAVDTPVPTMLTGSVTPVSPPDTLIAAPLATDVDERVEPSSPRAVLFDTAIIPAVNVVRPV
ncbi:MAG: hypothetical protein EB147_09365 [Acidimicrobiia bacterium]|nr:hypothetical protein [Acidimicrobiia bacterium]